MKIEPTPEISRGGGGGVVCALAIDVVLLVVTSPRPGVVVWVGVVWPMRGGRGCPTMGCRCHS